MALLVFGKRLVRAQDAEHAPEMAQLHEARADGEPQAQADQHHDQHLAPEQVVEQIKHGDLRQNNSVKRPAGGVSRGEVLAWVCISLLNGRLVGAGQVPWQAGAFEQGQAPGGIRGSAAVWRPMEQNVRQSAPNHLSPAPP